MLAGAIYENSASFLTMEIVLIANRNLSAALITVWLRRVNYLLVLFLGIRGNGHERIREHGNQNCAIDCLDYDYPR